MVGLWNWVRFAFFGGWHLAVGGWSCGIGFVSHSGGTACRARTGIGFVSHFWFVVGGL